MSNHQAPLLSSTQQQIRKHGVPGPQQPHSQSALTAHGQPPTGELISTYFANPPPPRPSAVAAMASPSNHPHSASALQQRRVKLLVLPIMGGNIAAPSLPPSDTAVHPPPARSAVAVTVVAPAPLLPAPSEQLLEIAPSQQKAKVDVLQRKPQQQATATETKDYDSGSDDANKEKRTSSIVCTSWVKRLEDFYSRVHPLVLKRIPMERSDQATMNYQRDVVILLAATGKPPRLFPTSFQPDEKVDVIVIGPPPAQDKHLIDQQQELLQKCRGESNEFVKCVAQYAPVYGKLYKGGMDMEREAHSLVGQVVQYINSRGGRFLNHTFGRDQWAESSLYAACNFTELELFREASKLDPSFKRKQTLLGPMQITESEDENEEVPKDKIDSIDLPKCCPCKMKHVKRKMKSSEENGESPAKRVRKKENADVDEVGVIQASRAEVLHGRTSNSSPSPEDSKPKKTVTKRKQNTARNMDSASSDSPKKKPPKPRAHKSKKAPKSAGQTKSSPASSDEDSVALEERHTIVSQTQGQRARPSSNKSKKTPARTKQQSKKKRPHSSDAETASEEEDHQFMHYSTPAMRPNQSLTASSASAWELRDASELFGVHLRPEHEPFYSREEQMRRLRMEQHYEQMRRYMQDKEAQMLVYRMEEQGQGRSYITKLEQQERKVKEFHQKQVSKKDSQCQKLDSKSIERAKRGKQRKKRNSRDQQNLTANESPKHIEVEESSQVAVDTRSTTTSSVDSDEEHTSKVTAGNKIAGTRHSATGLARKTNVTPRSDVRRSAGVPKGTVEEENSPTDRRRRSSPHPLPTRKHSPSVPEQMNMESDEESEPRVAEVSDERSAASESINSYVQYHMQAPIVLEGFSASGDKHELSLGGGLFSLFSGFTQRLASVFSTKGDSDPRTFGQHATEFQMHGVQHLNAAHSASYKELRSGHEELPKRSRPKRKKPPLDREPKNTVPKSKSRSKGKGKTCSKSHVSKDEASGTDERRTVDPMQLLINACAEHWDGSDA